MSAPSFSDATKAMLAQAVLLCARRGTRLTDLRRLVLGLVIDNGRPIGAYDLLERLRAYHKGSAPPTIYRALDFLREQGLIHKIERLSAFIGCVHAMEQETHNHAAGLLICQVCGHATEIEDTRIDEALTQAAHDVGFRSHGSTVEIEGTCAICIRRAEPAAPSRIGPLPRAS